MKRSKGKKRKIREQQDKEITVGEMMTRNEKKNDRRGQEKIREWQEIKKMEGKSLKSNGFISQ